MNLIKNQIEHVKTELAKYIDSDIRRINVLAELIMAIPLSRSTQGNDLAENIIRDVQDQSIQQMLSRFYKNDAITWECFYAPLVEILLKSLSLPTYYLVIDTTDVGKNHRALVLSLSYQNRSLPLIWKVEEGTKGHTKEDVQVDLLKKLAPYFQPANSDSPVIFLGDSEFDGVALQKQLRANGWHYILRTSPHLHICHDKKSKGIALGSLVSRPLSEQDAISEQTVTNVLFTKKHLYGPVSCYACWEYGHDIPLILIYHLPDGWQHSPRHTYKIRFSTEPLFADCKEDGFRLHKSRLKQPERLSRLFLAVSASYLWMTVLGAWAFVSHDTNQVDRSNRRTLSIFKTGWRWFKRQLKLGRFVSFSLLLPPLFDFPKLKYTKP